MFVKIASSVMHYRSVPIKISALQDDYQNRLKNDTINLQNAVTAEKIVHLGFKRNLSRLRIAGDLFPIASSTIVISLSLLSFVHKSIV